MRSLLSILLLGFIFLSCSKEQRIVNKLAGLWEVRSATITGVGEMNTDQVFDFEKCRIRKNNYCNFTLVDRDNQETTYGSYLIDESGNEVTLVFTEGLTTSIHVFTIEKVNWRKLILVNKEPQAGSFERFELRSR